MRRLNATETDRQVDRFLRIKTATLEARAPRLARLTPKLVGLRAEDLSYAPSSAHFTAANARLTKIEASIRRRLAELRLARRAPHRQRLLRLALVERDVDRARRAFGLFFEVFAQRGTSFAPALAAHDAIAHDCYAAARAGAQGLLQAPLLEPVTYLEHGYSPATMRRGVTLKRLLGEPNPWPLVRIPWDRDRPWQATFLHEVCHNLQADLGLWEENKQAIARRLAGTDVSDRQRVIWSRWHKEIFADLAAMLLGGPVVAWGIAEFLAHPETKVATYKPGGVHPTSFFRVLILAEMCRRMGFAEHAARLGAVWTRLYRPAAERRLPADLMQAAPRITPLVVDEIAYQPRRMLAERSVADVLRFTAKDQRRIEAGAAVLHKGEVPDLPPRYLVAAARLAIGRGAAIAPLGRLLIRHLARRYAQTTHPAAPVPAPQPLALAA